LGFARDCNPAGLKGRSYFLAHKRIGDPDAQI
jgi:hypothetical protein